MPQRAPHAMELTLPHRSPRRLTNLELLQKHGANTWLAHLNSLDVANSGLAAVRDELAGQIEAINRKRKAEQARAPPHAVAHRTRARSRLASSFCACSLPPVRRLCRRWRWRRTWRASSPNGWAPSRRTWRSMGSVCGWRVSAPRSSKDWAPTAAFES